MIRIIPSLKQFVSGILPRINHYISGNLYHGTSTSRLGNQAAQKVFEHRGQFSPVFVTHDRDFAEKYARRAAEQDGSKAVIVTLPGTAKFFYPDWGKHSHPAVKTPVEIVQVTVVKK